VRAVGVKETAFYPALSTLLNIVGKSLRPQAHCMTHPRGQGAGLPDGGLFTRDRLRGLPLDKAMERQIPARGVLEVKGSAADISSLVGSEQVARYWDRYRLVLMTNLWEFALVGDDGRGKPAVLASYRLAAFWAAAALPGATVERHDEGSIDFLRCSMVQAAPLTAPRDLAWFLASYARQALARVERGDLPALRGVREALEGALGLSFEGAQREHFFRSTLVQTLFYGIFSAWVLWCKEQPATSPTTPGWTASRSRRCASATWRASTVCGSIRSTGTSIRRAR